MWKYCHEGIANAIVNLDDDTYRKTLKAGQIMALDDRYFTTDVPIEMIDLSLTTTIDEVDEDIKVLTEKIEEIRTKKIKNEEVNKRVKQFEEILNHSRVYRDDKISTVCSLGPGDAAVQWLKKLPPTSKRTGPSVATPSTAADTSLADAALPRVLNTNLK
jgi:D-ribose pyranose/furanose isomerase RbsD